VKRVRYNVQENAGSTLPYTVVAVILLLGACGCSDRVQLPVPEQVMEFKRAVPVGPAVDMRNLVLARNQTGPYRVHSGEVIELNMPSILRVVTAEAQSASSDVKPFICRVGNNGTISLPVVGELPVVGMTLADIERAVTDAYYPTYAKMRPSVFAKILEYKTYSVTVTGAVRNPGLYRLRSDQMSLVALLMEAGGITDEGAAYIRIHHGESLMRQPHRVMKEMGGGSSHTATVKDSPYTFADYTGPGNCRGTLGSEFQLSFRPYAGHKTYGRLLLKKRNTSIIDDWIDLTSSSDRQAVLENAARQDATLSVNQLNVTLRHLSEQLCKQVSAEHPVQLVSNAVEPVGGLPDAPRSIAVPQRQVVANDARSDNTIVLPVKGLNIPFEDVSLQEGDSITVERLIVPLYTVIGLVKAEGNYEYPPGARFNLMQAIAFAGGLDPKAEPHYAVVYRLKPDGSIMHLTFDVRKPLAESPMTSAMNVIIQPGDIIAVERTPRTRAVSVLKDVIRINIGGYIPIVR